jgi:antitoxin component of MazEF toxin-antitoxin module
MKKKLTKHGNSTALVLDKALLELLGLSSQSEVEIAIKDGKMIVSPIKKSKRSKNDDIDDIAERIMDKYSDLFKKLSKT